MTSPPPLDGLRIIDMSSVVMGPFATQILGDLGADVIKVEPHQGDTTRHVTPMRGENMGWVFLHANRNKRSIVLDLKDPAGKEALLKLAEGVDAIVTNVRTRALDRLGLGWETLQARNPRLILVNLVGYGAGGPYDGRPTYEDLIQGVTALPSMLVQAGSEEPHYVPMAMNDRAVGVSSAVALLAAVIHREKSGRGQQIEVPMFETMAQWVLGDHMGGKTFEPPLGPAGYKRTLTKERRPYKTRDGRICSIIYTDKHWRTFMELIGQSEVFRTDPRFANIGTRTDHAHDLYAYVSQAMQERTSAEWLEVLLAADIPVTPLHDLDSLIEDEHLMAVGYLPVVDHPTEGKVRQVRIPSTWSDSQPTIRRQPPGLGEHSVEVLREAGLSEQQIATLIERGVTVQPGYAPDEEAV
ncbi:CoA transferase [Sphingomonas sp. TF3]|uniref:CaiB/BaiF CoA transferase family protein n=1 Tax=Sphingomonas sp. TF3 TaxID=2495580 RepID=UPI000F8977F6|nr:CoA transferase [Sphingomonas sp. TF3]RUN78353.1 CoA transferase [Sphingomonas sp. TF3]